MPADPFEAELLMMAEAVEKAEKGSDDDSESDDDDVPPCKLLRPVCSLVTSYVRIQHVQFLVTKILIITFTHMSLPALCSHVTFPAVSVVTDLPVETAESGTDATVVIASTAEQATEFGEDMLQMALRMASEMPADEHALELGGSLAPAAINTSKLLLYPM